jgi:hypothetical protein
MEIVNSYFDNIIFFKTDRKENYAIYAALISSSYGDGRKTYALAFVPNHVAILEKGFLKDLHWQNFQTRNLSNGWKIQSQRWDLRKLNGIPTPMFKMIERTDVKTKYVCETEPLEMILLHDPKKKSVYQYHNRINMLAALSTFNCVLNFSEGHEMQATRSMDHQNFAQSSLPGRRLDSSSIPISSLAVRTPQQSPVYRATDLPENTTYTPRNEGTKYAANSADAMEGGYDFNQSIVVGNTGYRNLSLDISVPQGRQEVETRGRRVQESIDDSFELL